jgi:DNA-binding HxlR family transcriptional regulator
VARAIQARAQGTHKKALRGSLLADLDLPIAPNVLSQGCASRRVLELVSDKWVALVVFALVGGPKRHADLLQMIEGISQKMLTQTLRTLERDGFVSRTVLAPEPPMHVEYSLTPLGETLSEPLVALCDWAMGHIGEVDAARRANHGRPL